MGISMHMRIDGLFQFSIDNALEIIIVFNNNMQIIYANQAARRKLEFADLEGHLVTDIFHGEVESDGTVVLNGGELREMMAYRSNNTCFPVEVRLLMYEEEQEKGAGNPLYICMADDVTKMNSLEKEAVRAEQEAQKALKVKSEFVANVTHELRTPVNGIMGNTQELLESETDKDRIKLLRLVERGCRDMNSIINNILDFSKLEAGKFTLEPRRFNFTNMIEYVKSNHSNKITEKGLDFTVSISPEIPEYIIGDELRIVQVLNNLISNAYKFTAVGGIHVETVKTAQTGSRMELFFMVIDTGIGIAKSEQDKLFKSFSQVDASISRKYGGTGLGLNICKQLVELMGGSIHVKSDAGKGTMFSFNIWVEAPEQETEGTVRKNEAENAEDEDETRKKLLLNKLDSLNNTGVSDKMWKYGEPETLSELEKKMSKLILSVEMENWEKAEMFADTVKQLLEEAPPEVRNASLRLKMAVQKGDYEKTSAAFDKLKKMVLLA